MIQVFKKEGNISSTLNSIPRNCDSGGLLFIQESSFTNSQALPSFEWYMDQALGKIVLDLTKDNENEIVLH